MKPRELRFSETMAGPLLFDARSIELPLAREEFSSAVTAGRSCSFSIDVIIDDIDAFCNDPQREAAVAGSIDLGDGESYPIEEGRFNLFVRPEGSTAFNVRKEMVYCLYFRDKQGQELTLFGSKQITREGGLDVWQETTTLYSYIWRGHCDFEEGAQVDLQALGLLHISVEGFAKQLGTFKTGGSNPIEHLQIVTKFLNIFAENIWEAYAPAIFGTDRARWNDHPIPLRSTDGVHGCDKEIIPLNTDDGLYLQMQRFCAQKSEDVVLLLHGLTTSTDMFIMPEHYNLVQYLLDNGLSDVWSLDWRGSNHYSYNLEPHRYSIDDTALYDIPAAIAAIKQRCGEGVRIHVIAHCVGSIAFASALASGLTSNIASFTSNSVSLTPRVRWQAYLKLMAAPTLIEYLFGYPYLSPKMPYYPGPGFGRWIWWMERALRRECKEPSCHMVSFMWGWGFPAAYRHENLSPITHRRLADLFGGTAVHYYRHIFKMLRNKAALPYSRKELYSNLPPDYLQACGERELPPIMFISGDHNLIFPESNRTSYEQLRKLNPAAQLQYREFVGYGHQDVFMGKNAAEDVFGDLVNFIKAAVE